MPAGAATALLAVVLLAKGLGGFAPAHGADAFFYAVLFGFSQQAFTQLVDKEAKALLGEATTRGTPGATATAAHQP